MLERAKSTNIGPTCPFCAARWRRASELIAILILAASLLLILVLNPHSVVAYFYGLLVSIVSYPLLVNRGAKEAFFLYVIYSFGVLAVYVWQLLALPEYFGFSGGLGTGTDDSFFYSQIASALPKDLPILQTWIQPFSYFLLAIVPFGIDHPLDVLLINALPLVFIPAWTSQMAYHIVGDRHVADRAYLLVMICPFLLSNGLILVREAWITAAFVGSLAFGLKGRLAQAAILMAFIAYIRMGSFLSAIVVWFCFMLIYYQGIKSKSFRFIYTLFFILLSVLFITILYPSLGPYLKSKGLEGTLYRSSGVDFIEATAQADSVRLRLVRGSWASRIVGGSIYYFASPLLRLDTMIRDGTILPRSLLTAAYAVLFVVYLRFFIQAVFHAWYKKDWVVILTILAYLATVMILAQASTQVRHKVMLLPIFYVIVSYGFSAENRSGNVIAVLASLGLFLVEAAFNLFRAW